MNEEERIREEALLSNEELVNKVADYATVGFTSIDYKGLMRVVAIIAQAQLDKILSLKTGSLTLKELTEKYEKGELLEKADNQDLPLSGPYSLATVEAVRRARQDMLTPKDGYVWVKCLSNQPKIRSHILTDEEFDRAQEEFRELGSNY